MSTFRDWLEYYSKLDVGPFVQAIDAYKQYFLKQNVDVFKDNVSVPGIARRLLYQSGVEQGASFSLIDKGDSDLYDTLKANLIGGPFDRVLSSSTSWRDVRKGRPNSPLSFHRRLRREQPLSSRHLPVHARGSLYQACRMSRF